MKPIVCFYKNSQVIESTHYEIFSCADSESVTSFLKDIHERFPNELKIIQVNFNAHEKSANTNCQLYASAKAHVFLIKSYKMAKDNKNSSLDQSEKLAFKLKINKQEFLDKVSLIKEMIGQGRFYQINFTSYLECESTAPPETFYSHMAAHFKGSYRAFLPLPQANIISFSPELFIKKNGHTLITAPIKGSHSTSKDLMDSEKEAAELSMIVDLLRNDLNSLETSSSAVVTKHRELMNLNYIQHTYSEIEIETRKDLPFILERMMPGGSISGCPKRESLIAISELENYQRQAYTGVIGWWEKDDFELNIAIRTFVHAENKYHYFAGCGIVYDSDPESEFQELIRKTGSLNVHYT